MRSGYLVDNCKSETGAVLRGGIATLEHTVSLLSGNSSSVILNVEASWERANRDLQSRPTVLGGVVGPRPTARGAVLHAVSKEVLKQLLEPVDICQQSLVVGHDHVRFHTPHSLPGRSRDVLESHWFECLYLLPRTGEFKEVINEPIQPVGGIQHMCHV